MIFSFIDQNKDTWAITLMCSVLEVSPSGYYAWLSRSPSPQQQRRAAILVEIRAIHAEFKHRYGSPRM